MALRYRVRYVMLPAKSIFGMVGRCGGGYNTVWADWTYEGRRKRELIMQEFEQGLDAISGHYRKLEESILKDGIRNPIIITSGHPRKRKLELLPPEMLTTGPVDGLLLLETTVGGSRLHVCQKHDMVIPCLVNDWHGRFGEFPEVTTIEEARSYFKDQPNELVFHRRLGLIETFDPRKVGYHLGEEWSEDRIMPKRAAMWVKIMNKYGYRVDGLPPDVLNELAAAGIDQSGLN